MKKKTSMVLQVVTTFLTLLPVVLGIIFWDRLPAQIPVHFDSAGNPNRYAGKLMAIVKVPVIMVLLHSLFVMRGRRRDEAALKEFNSVMLWFCPVISNVVTLTSLRKAVDESLNTKMVSVFMIAGFSIVMGFYFRKVKQNSVLGIKTPWTVSDEENWEKTHRLAGKVWIVMGCAVAGMACLDIRISNIVMLWILIAIVFPVMYSYRNRAQ